MTIQQIKYFVTAARLLNFTKAAEILYMSQSVLSRQISAIESELNMQLFIRGNRYVRLTPAGIVLYKEFSDVYDRYLKGVENAQNTNKGIAGVMHIGILDGTYVSDFMPELLSSFKRKYPALEITLQYQSFAELIQGILDKSLDLIFSLQFNVDPYADIIYNVLEKTPDNLVLHKSHALFEKEELSLRDFEGQDLILISPDNLSLTRTDVLPYLKKLGTAPNIHFAPNLQTAMLWCECGLGAAYLFSRNTLHRNQDLRFVQMSSPWDTSFVVAWDQTNYNASIPLICDYCEKKFNDG